MTAAKAILLACGLVAACGAARAESVGSVGAVNQSAKGTPPGAGTHALRVGGDVQMRERIETSGAGNAQIVFRDTSTMTIGRNSAVTIDHFVYNSQAGTGRQGVSLAKGVLRFVGGNVSHGSGAQLRTPAASVAVRGGTAILSIDDAHGMLVVLLSGVITVSTASASETLTIPGYGVYVSADGVISQPFRVSADQMAQLLQQLESGFDQHGGAVDPPGNPQAHQRLGDNRPPNDVPPPGLEGLAQFWTGDSLVQSNTTVNNQPAPPTPTTTTQSSGGGR